MASDEGGWPLPPLVVVVVLAALAAAALALAIVVVVVPWAPGEDEPPQPAWLPLLLIRACAPLALPGLEELGGSGDLGNDAELHQFGPLVLLGLVRINLKVAGVDALGDRGPLLVADLLRQQEGIFPVEFGFHEDGSARFALTNDGGKWA